MGYDTASRTDATDTTAEDHGLLHLVCVCETLNTWDDCSRRICETINLLLEPLVIWPALYFKEVELVVGQSLEKSRLQQLREQRLEACYGAHGDETPPLWEIHVDQS
jgi:hypothetical protein